MSTSVSLNRYIRAIVQLGFNFAHLRTPIRVEALDFFNPVGGRFFRAEMVIFLRGQEISVPIVGIEGVDELRIYMTLDEISETRPGLDFMQRELRVTVDSHDPKLASLSQKKALLMIEEFVRKRKVREFEAQ